MCLFVALFVYCACGLNCLGSRWIKSTNSIHFVTSQISNGQMGPKYFAEPESEMHRGSTFLLHIFTICNPLCVMKMIYLYVKCAGSK